MPKEKITTSNTVDATEVQIDPLELLKDKWGANNSNSNKNKQNSQKLAKVDNSLPKKLKSKIEEQENLKTKRDEIETRFSKLNYPKNLARTLSIQKKEALLLKVEENKKNQQTKKEGAEKSKAQMKAFEENKKAGKVSSTEEKVEKLSRILFPRQELIKQLPDEDIEEWRKYYQEQLKDESLSDEMKERYLKKLKTIREYKEFIDEVEVAKKIIIKKE